MAGLKEIRRRLGSVRNTKKITYAMKLVSAAKLRRAQESVMRAREYTSAINNLLAELSQEQGQGNFSHPLLEPRMHVRKIRLLVVGGNRGLCGGYNTNLHKRLESFLKEKQAAGVEADFYLIGRKPAEYFRRINRSYVKSFEKLQEDANLWPIEEICFDTELAFMDGSVDEVYLLFTRFKSALSMTVLCERLLPLDAGLAHVQGASHASATLAAKGVTRFEPSVKEVFSAVIPRILRSKLRQACLDAKASEHGSRMTAMDSATKNAGDLIHSLNLTYNKIRQSGITSQLLDIVGGAEALGK